MWVKIICIINSTDTHYVSLYKFGVHFKYSSCAKIFMELFSTDIQTYIQTYRQTYRPSDEVGPKKMNRQEALF